MMDAIISQDGDGSVWLDSIPTDDLSKELGEEPERWELVRFAGDTLVTRERNQGMHRLFAFIDDDGAGHAAYLHFGRALTRAGS